MADEVAHNKHVGEVMAGLSSPEFVGWIEYFKIKDEVQRNMVVWAICRAFNGDKDAKGTKPQQDDEDEEVIDTTDPSFAEHFAGFINEPGKPQAQGTGMNIAQVQAQQKIMGTQILMG